MNFKTWFEISSVWYAQFFRTEKFEETEKATICHTSHKPHPYNTRQYGTDFFLINKVLFAKKNIKVLYIYGNQSQQDRFTQ
jgi:hypothetical protein